MKPKTSNLLNFAKGETLPKINLWITLSYKNGVVTCKAHSIYPETNDMVFQDVAGLTPEEIAHFDSLDVSDVIEKERNRIMSELSKQCD